MNVLSSSRLQTETFPSFQLGFPAAAKQQVCLAEEDSSVYAGLMSLIPGAIPTGCCGMVQLTCRRLAADWGVLIKHCHKLETR